jgi:hypothetical protein
MLLGALWAVMFMLAWTGAGASGRPRPVRTLIGPPDLAGSTDPGQPGSDNAPAPSGADSDPDDHRDRPDPDDDPGHHRDHRDHRDRPEPGGEVDRRRGPRLAR